MRQKVIKHFGNNNVLVGFDVGWTLAALQLPVNAERVVDLFVEPAFAALSYNLARMAQLASTTGLGGTVGKVSAVANLFFKQKAPLDRRWPAVLFENGIELRPNQCDNVYAEAVYTAAIRRAVHSTVIRTRQLLEVRRVRSAYSVCEGNSLSSTESSLARIKQDLLQRTDAYGDNYTITTPPAKRDYFFRSVEIAHCAIRSLVFDTTLEAYVLFIQTCERLALKADLTSSDEPYFDFYVVDPAIRCKVAVDIALPAKFISRDAPLTLVWANHLSDQLICGSLRYLNFQSTEIALDDRLLWLTLCYINSADSKGTFNYQKYREVFIVESKPVNVT